MQKANKMSNCKDYTYNRVGLFKSPFNNAKLGLNVNPSMHFSYKINKIGFYNFCFGYFEITQAEN